MKFKFHTPFVPGDLVRHRTNDCLAIVGRATSYTGRSHRDYWKAKHPGRVDSGAHIELLPIPGVNSMKSRWESCYNEHGIPRFELVAPSPMRDYMKKEGVLEDE